MADSTAWQNWAGNQRSIASSVARPTSTDEVAGLVRAARGRRPDDQTHRHWSLFHRRRGHHGGTGGARRPDRVDPRRPGARSWSASGPARRWPPSTRSSPSHGLAMPNLGDIDVQTVSGALATGTHGTGVGYGCLSTFVEALELVLGTGEVVRCSRDGTARHLPGRPGRRRRDRGGHRGDPALRGRVHPARRRAPDTARRRAGQHRRTDLDQRPLRVLLDAVHREDADQVEQPGAGRRPAPRRLQPVVQRRPAGEHRPGRRGAGWPGPRRR